MGTLRLEVILTDLYEKAYEKLSENDLKSIEPRQLCMNKMMKWVSFIKMDYCKTVFDENEESFDKFMENAKKQVKFYCGKDEADEVDKYKIDFRIYREMVDKLNGVAKPKETEK